MTRRPPNSPLFPYPPLFRSNVRTGLVGSCHFDHGQVTDDCWFMGDVLNEQDVDQFIQIGFDAAGLGGGVGARDRHARDFRSFRAAHGQRIDIESAAAEQRGYARQHARFVFHVHHVCVQHVFSIRRFYSSAAVSTILLGRRIISCNDAPAATIGYTVSSCSTRKLINTGPSCCRAARTDGTTCERSVTVMLRMPYASPSLAKSGFSSGVAA